MHFILTSHIENAITCEKAASETIFSFSTNLLGVEKS